MPAPDLPRRRHRSSATQWCRDHSLSLTLFGLGLVLVVASVLVEHGSWMYDFTMGLGLAFWATAGFLRLSARLVERDADPLRTREEIERDRL